MIGGNATRLCQARLIVAKKLDQFWHHHILSQAGAASPLRKAPRTASNDLLLPGGEGTQRNSDLEQ